MDLKSSYFKMAPLIDNDVVSIESSWIMLNQIELNWIDFNEVE